MTCEEAIRTQASSLGVPVDLAIAISKVESGMNPLAIAWLEPGVQATPENGRSYYAASKDGAVEKVLALKRRGIKPDVGCMQVSLKHHEYAFQSIADGFRAEVNVRYGLEYLSTLRAKHGSWPLAAAHYHNGKPGPQFTYLQRVLGAMSALPVVTPLVGAEKEMQHAGQPVRQVDARRLRARFSTTAVHSAKSEQQQTSPVISGWIPVQ